MALRARLKAWALTDLAKALLGTGVGWSPRENAELMLLGGDEEAAKEAVETWLKVYENDQRALREYMKEAARATPRSSTNVRRLRRPSKKGRRRLPDRGGSGHDPSRRGESAPLQAYVPVKLSIGCLLRGGACPVQYDCGKVSFGLELGPAEARL
jgi:hypothetical protein